MSHLFCYPGHELLIKDIVRTENCYLYDYEDKRYIDPGLTIEQEDIKNFLSTLTDILTQIQFVHIC